MREIDYFHSQGGTIVNLTPIVSGAINLLRLTLGKIGDRETRRAILYRV